MFAHSDYVPPASLACRDVPSADMRCVRGGRHCSVVRTRMNAAGRRALRRATSSAASRVVGSLKAVSLHSVAQADVDVLVFAVAQDDPVTLACRVQLVARCLKHASSLHAPRPGGALAGDDAPAGACVRPWHCTWPPCAPGRTPASADVAAALVFACGIVTRAAESTMQGLDALKLADGAWHRAPMHPCVGARARWRRVLLAALSPQQNCARWRLCGNRSLGPPPAHAVLSSAGPPQMRAAEAGA